MFADGDSLSSALGWVSIACWIVVYSPQFYENYKLKSGEGLSVLFVLTWLLGDICNLVGAVMAGLLPTVIILACYYTACDLGLLMQIYYYRWTHPVHPVIPGVVLYNEEGEEAPLLAERRERVLHKKDLETPSVGKQVARYCLALVFVVATGIVAWRISGEDKESKEKVVLEWKSQVIGWTSAILYLGSRIPQIFKNIETKCEGLSLALFFFAIAGNTTYALSICVALREWKELIANGSWLAGSVLTIFLDVFVLCQFFYFRAESPVFITDGQLEAVAVGDVEDTGGRR